MGRPRIIQDLELAFLVGKGMTQKEIAEQLKVSLPTVKDALRRVRAEHPELLEEKTIEVFRQEESDDLANMRRVILHSLRRKLNTLSLSTVSIQQLSTLYGILFDKDRLLRGEATEHIATATYNQLDNKTREVIGDAVKKLTVQMISEAQKSESEEEE